MMIGGLFLCYEGMEKVAHKFLHRDGEDAAHHAEHLAALADPAKDLVQVEKGKIKGAIRTDFVLSAEIIVITIGTMSEAPMMQQVIALSIVAIGATVLVYGLVAGIVKLDDLGVKLKARADATSQRIGAGILRAAPIMMKGLSIIGTFAMFTVGGGILAHGIPVIEHFIEGVTHSMNGIVGTLVKTLLDAAVGVAAGVLALGLMTGIKRLRGTKESVAAA